MNQPSEIIWLVGIGVLLIGEFWAVFSSRRNDTLTEHVFKTPYGLGAMGGLLVWGIYHFFIAGGLTDWWDLIPLTLGISVGVIAWFFNRDGWKRKRR